MRQIIILIFLFSSIDIFSQYRNYSIDTIQVKSEILKENRCVIIYTPHNISKTESVKYIYLIDGQYSNYRFQRLKEHYKDSISNLIGIGIIPTDRRRDLLYINGADKFLDFITSELIPTLEKDYNVSTRILYGHSFGGGFTIYSLINKPNCFNCFIASSPTPIMKLINKEDYQRIDSISKSKTVFYFSYGSKDMAQVRKWSYRLNNNLAGLKFSNFDWRFNIFEGKNHNNSDIPALIYGLTEIK